jgi:amino acid transporter
MKGTGALFITLSATTPAASVFIIAPGVMEAAGSGAVWALLLAAVVGLAMAGVYAELSSAYPHAGGEYVMVGRTLGPLPGFMVLALNLFNCVATCAVLALGTATYLEPLLPGLDPGLVALGVIVLATLLGVLNIRTNAWITGAFLLVELAALLVLAWLGYSAPVRPVSEVLLHPTMLGESGLMTAAPVAAIGLAVAVAVFAYDGYGAACYFAEEVADAPKRIARVVLAALGIAVAAELVPITAVLVGASDLHALFSAGEGMLPAFMTEHAGAGVAAAISAGVALAIVNAVIALILLTARQLYAMGRDGTFSPAVDAGLARTHPTWRSPWVATLVAGAMAVSISRVPLDLLLVVTGTGLTLIYAALCLAALARARVPGERARSWAMPLFPLAPVLALLVLGGVVGADALDPEEGRTSLIASAAVLAVGAAYYLIVLKRRGWSPAEPQQ